MIGDNIMPQVDLRLIVSFSSQDPRNPADNILQGDGRKKWLSSPKDRSGRLECVIQLEKMCTISHVDIGTHFVFSVQIEVGRSDWPVTEEFVTLLPNTTFMTPLECRKEKHKTSMRMFNKEHFHEKSVNKKWDRIKVVCTQPFRKDVQIGLSLLRIVTNDDDDDETQSISRKKTELNPAHDSSFEESNHTSERSNSVLAIQKYFFGEASSGESPSNGLQSNLAKIASLAENVNMEGATMSRNIKLVLAANSNITETQKPLPHTTGVEQLKPVPIKQNLPFPSEVVRFLSGLDLMSMDVDKITFADLRHSFEQQKCRKLTKEERKLFFKKAQKFIQNIALSDSQSNSLLTCDADPRTFEDSQHLSKKMKLETSDFLPSKRMTSAGQKQPQNKTFNKEISHTKGFESIQRHKEIILDTKNHGTRSNNDYYSKKDDSDTTRTQYNESEHSILSYPVSDDVGVNEEGCVACPVCNGFFPKSQIEMHAANCGTEVPNETVSEHNSFSDLDQAGQCPICKSIYPLSQLIDHAEVCSSSKTLHTEL